MPIAAPIGWLISQCSTPPWASWPIARPSSPMIASPAGDPGGGRRSVVAHARDREREALEALIEPGAEVAGSRRLQVHRDPQLGRPLTAAQGHERARRAHPGGGVGQYTAL
jgi:hypothetical protein